MERRAGSNLLVDTAPSTSTTAGNWKQLPSVARDDSETRAILPRLLNNVRSRPLVARRPSGPSELLPPLLPAASATGEGRSFDDSELLRISTQLSELLKIKRPSSLNEKARQIAHELRLSAHSRNAALHWLTKQPPSAGVARFISALAECEVPIDEAQLDRVVRLLTALTDDGAMSVALWMASNRGDVYARLRRELVRLGKVREQRISNLLKLADHSEQP